MSDYDKWKTYRREDVELCVCHIQNDCPTHSADNWDKKKPRHEPLLDTVKPPCPDCGGKKTVLTEKDRLGLRYIIDCPTCNGTGEVKR